MNRRRFIGSLLGAGFFSFAGFSKAFALTRHDHQRSCRGLVVLTFKHRISLADFYKKSRSFYNPEVISKLETEFMKAGKIISRDLSFTGTQAKVAYVFTSPSAKSEFYRRTIEAQPQLRNLIHAKTDDHVSVVLT